MAGNTDNATPVTYFFKAHFQGRFVRVIPTGRHNQYTSLAFDILVCPHGNTHRLKNIISHSVLL